MKKYLAMAAIMIAVIVSQSTFVSCSNDDEDGGVTKSEVSLTPILGSWADISESKEGSVSMVVGLVYTFKSNKTCTQYVYVALNGKKIKENTIQFYFDYDGKNITLYENADKSDKSPTRWTVTVNGNKMKLGNAEDGYHELTKQ